MLYNMKLLYIAIEMCHLTSVIYKSEDVTSELIVWAWSYPGAELPRDADVK